MIISSPQILKMCESSMKVYFKEDKVEIRVPWDKNIVINYQKHGDNLILNSDYSLLNNVSISQKYFCYLVYYLTLYLSRENNYPETWIEYVDDQGISITDLYIKDFCLDKVHNEVIKIIKRGISIEDIQTLMSFDYYEEIEGLFSLFKILAAVFYE